MERIDGASPRPTSHRRGALAAALCLIATAGGGCWQSSQHHGCQAGDRLPCTTQCGEGSRTCGEGGTFGECEESEEVPCVPGEIGTCILPGGEQGMWTCTRSCDIGPCEPGCASWQTRPCRGECGAGEAPCIDGGVWGACEEHVSPACRPGEIRRCWQEPGHQRCREDCTFGPCEEAPCAPGELATCVTPLCGLEVCREDGTWSGCEMECIPGEVRVCGGGRMVCSTQCLFGECGPHDWRPDFP